MSSSVGEHGPPRTLGVVGPTPYGGPVKPEERDRLVRLFTAVTQAKAAHRNALDARRSYVRELRMRGIAPMELARAIDRPTESGRVDIAKIVGKVQAGIPTGAQPTAAERTRLRELFAAGRAAQAGYDAALRKRNAYVRQLRRAGVGPAEIAAAVGKPTESGRVEIHRILRGGGTAH